MNYTIIKDLEKNSKLDDDTRNALLLFKVDSSDTDDNNDIQEEKSNSKEEAASLFDIKLLNDLEDKVIRGSAKKIYMAGKRENKSSKEVIEDILNQLSDKLDDKSKILIEGLE